VVKENIFTTKVTKSTDKADFIKL